MPENPSTQAKTGSSCSRKQGLSRKGKDTQELTRGAKTICMRRIKLQRTGEVYGVCPSFVMPYMVGYTADVEHALFLQGFGVPFWALTHVFRRDDMYWYRLTTAFGRNSIVGTTVIHPESLPRDLLADEKHTKLDEGVVLDKILALCEKGPLFAQAYDHPSAHRTSNRVNRLMRWQDRYLFGRQYFHRSWEAAELGIRAWAILRNFRPLCPRAIGTRTDGACAAERLNGFRYCDSWLENLRVSSSLCGYRQ